MIAMRDEPHPQTEKPDIPPAPQTEPEWLERLAVLDVRPGDVIVVRAPRALSGPTMKYLSNAVQHAVGGGCKVLILDSGMDIGVLRPTGEGA